MVGPSQMGKSQIIYTWPKNGFFHQNLINFFHQHSHPFYDVMLEAVENLEFVQGVHFGFIDALKKQLHKELDNH